MLYSSVHDGGGLNRKVFVDVHWICTQSMDFNNQIVSQDIFSFNFFIISTQ